MVESDLIFYKRNRFGIFVKYNSPEEHSHFAKHIIIAENPILFKIEGENLLSSGLIIQSNVSHKLEYEEGEIIFTMLIDEGSKFSDYLDDNFLMDRRCIELPEEILEKSKLFLKELKIRELDKYLMENLYIDDDENREVDDRIKKAIDYIEEIETIDSTLFKKISAITYLSESRFSHLFREEMGTSFKNYILHKRIQRVCELVMIYGYSITDAAIEAGFSSSSHFSTACKNKFGISLTDFMNSLNWK